MWNIIEAFRKYGLPVIGGGAVVGSLTKGVESILLSLASVEQSASRAEGNISCYLGIIAILCAAGYFGLRPHEAVNAIESQK